MINRTTVSLISEPSLEYYGALYQVKDSSIFISSSTRFKNYTFGNSNFGVSEIEIFNIQKIKTVSKTRARNGARIGAASGFVIGCLLAIRANHQPSGEWDLISFSDTFVGLAGGLLCASLGAFSGVIIGGISIKIPINGSMDNYNQHKEKLKRYSIKN